MNLRKYLSTMRDYDSDDMLGLMGLQKSTASDWVFPMLAGVGAGMAIGAGIAFFLTPYKGTEAREKFVKASGEAQKFLNQQVGTLSDKVALLTEKVSTLSGGEAEKPAGSVTTARTMNVGGTGSSGVGGVGASSGIGGATGGATGNGNRGY